MVFRVKLVLESHTHRKIERMNFLHRISHLIIFSPFFRATFIEYWEVSLCVCALGVLCLLVAWLSILFTPKVPFIKVRWTSNTIVLISANIQLMPFKYFDGFFFTWSRKCANGSSTEYKTIVNITSHSHTHTYTSTVYGPLFNHTWKFLSFLFLLLLFVFFFRASDCQKIAPISNSCDLINNYLITCWRPGYSLKWPFYLAGWMFNVQRKTHQQTPFFSSSYSFSFTLIRRSIKWINYLLFTTWSA